MNPTTEHTESAESASWCSRWRSVERWLGRAVVSVAIFALALAISGASSS